MDSCCAHRAERRWCAHAASVVPSQLGYLMLGLSHADRRIAAASVKLRKILVAWQAIAAAPSDALSAERVLDPATGDV